MHIPPLSLSLCRVTCSLKLSLLGLYNPVLFHYSLYACDDLTFCPPFLLSINTFVGMIHCGISILVSQSLWFTGCHLAIAV
jgi:hypothetical protein